MIGAMEKGIEAAQISTPPVGAMIMLIYLSCQSTSVSKRHFEGKTSFKNLILLMVRVFSVYFL